MAAKTPRPLSEMKFYILLALSQESMHGYGIHEQIVLDSGSSLYPSHTTLYRHLVELARQGLVKAAGVARGEGAQRQRYSITNQGKRLLRSEAAQWAEAARRAAERL